VISHHISAWHRTLFDPSAATSRPCSVQSHDGAGLGQRIRRSDAVVGDLVHRGIPGGVQGRDHQPFPNRWRRYRRRGMSRGQSCVAPTRDRRGGMVASTAWTSATRTHSCQQLGPVRSIPGGSGLDSPATPAGCDGCGHYCGFRDRRRARFDCRGDHRDLRYRCADDSNSSYACSSDGHVQPPSVAVAVASSASMEAMIA
jgi:hypothetical protein